MVKPRGLNQEPKDTVKDPGSSSSCSNSSSSSTLTTATTNRHVNGSPSDQANTPADESDIPVDQLDADGTPAPSSSTMSQPGHLKMDHDQIQQDRMPRRGRTSSSASSRLSDTSQLSLDYRDFDTSFSSFKSSETMEQEDLADQLSLVQQMVVEMKQGFATAMEELSKIQYGDQNLQSQLADNKRECSEEIGQVRKAVEDLRLEVEKLCNQLRDVTEVQRGLQDKINSYQSDKDILIDELQKNGTISDQLRARLSASDGRRHTNSNKNNNNKSKNMSEVAPMMHPYLDSLQSHRGPEDHYNSDSSLTAAVSRSLSLTQALGEKCLQLDFSATSSDEEDNSRHSQSQGSSQHKPNNRQGSFTYDESSRHGQKVPPHEKVMEEVHREEAARDIVEAEREYCSQIWTLVDTYMNTLKQEEIISHQELHTLFPTYIPHIYEQHCIMLRKLEDRMSKWKFSGVIGDVFAKLTDSQDGDGLSLYKDYINDFPAIINGINKWFAQSVRFREIMQSPCLATASILPLLLAPLQQVPKYSLLLKNIVKYTPADHPDRYYLESSLNKLKLFLNMMNDDLEHAMQVLNINREPINRSRDSGNSLRSRSSGSSGEVNHMSSARDSGIHSNGEDHIKSPASPNTARRLVLQVLREKREHDAEMYERADGHPGTPRGRKQPRFGSQPDLSSHLQGLQEGRASPYVSSLPQSKMFSSLSKLPLPQEKGKKVRIRKRQEGQHPGINPNYLRPLTPQILSTHFEGQGRRREENYDRQRLRPQSAMEFSTEPVSHNDRWLDMMSYNSPRHSSGSERSRKELHLSLQKLLAETNNEMQEDSDQEEDNRNTSSYHKQYLATRDKILRRGSDRERGQYSNMYNPSSLQRGQGRMMPDPSSPEDYGIYGDDDEDEEEEFDSAQEVKPMKILQESHRPKIMVPRWRQNASPQPPSYSSSVDIIHKSREFTSEESLAASLAQSLMEGSKQQTEKSKTLPITNRMKNSSSADSVRRRSLPQKDKAQEDTERPGRSAPLDAKDSGEKQRHKVVRSQALRIETPPTSPTNDSSVSYPSDSKGKRDSVDRMKGAFDGNSGVEKADQIVSPQNGVSNAMLTDVIAYTADCLEKSESAIRVSTGSESDTSQDVSVSSPSSPSPTNIVKTTPSVTKTSSLTLGSTAVQKATPPANLSISFGESPPSTTQSLSHKFSPPSQSPTPVSSADNSKPSSEKTESLLYYFQNRNQLNKPSMANGSTFPSSSTPSSPVSDSSAKEYALDTTVVSAEQSRKKAGMERAADSKGRGVSADGPQSGVSSSVTLNKGTSVNNAPPVQSDVIKPGSMPRAVERLKQSFERKGNSVTFDSTDGQATGKPNNKRPYSSKYDTQKQPLVLKTFALPQNSEETKEEKSPQKPAEQTEVSGNSSEQTQRMYRKAASLKTAGKYLGEASARQISKLERSTSPTGAYLKDVDQNRNPTPQQTTPVKPMRRGNSPQRPVSDGSLIPQKSLSPTRNLALDRPMTPQGPLMGRHSDSQKSDEESQGPLKSSLKDTKIPVLRKTSPGGAGSYISKSTEDISKMKKKSALNSLKHIFGRKKKKSKMFSNGLDIEEDFTGMMDGDPYFHSEVDEIFSFPLSAKKRSHSTSHILQNYQFEEDYSDPVSAV